MHKLIYNCWREASWCSFVLYSRRQKTYKHSWQKTVSIFIHHILQRGIAVLHILLL